MINLPKMDDGRTLPVPTENSGGARYRSSPKRGSGTIAGLSDGAFVSIGLLGRVTARRDRPLKVRDLHQNRSYDLLRVMRKGGAVTRSRSTRSPRRVKALSFSQCYQK